MFEKFTSQGANDFRQRYQGTFGFFRNDHEKKAPFLCKLSFVENAVKFIDKRGIEYTLNPDVEEQIGFHFLPPKAGYFNTDTGAMLVTRQAARQFQRGISDRNTQMYNLSMEAGFRGTPVDFTNLEKVFYSKMTVDEAVARFHVGKAKSVALSTQFATEGKNIYVMASHIGTVIRAEPEKWVISLNDKDLFRTEINDALKGLTKVEFQ